MGKQQRVDLLRRLIHREVADTRQDLEPVRPRHVTGGAFGGALSNYATASVSDSAFTDNLARAGNLGMGDFAATGRSSV